MSKSPSTYLSDLEAFAYLDFGMAFVHGGEHRFSDAANHRLQVYITTTRRSSTAA